MQLNVAEIKRELGARVEQEGTWSLPSLEVEGTEYVPVGAGKYRVEATNTGKALLVQGWVEGSFRVPCSRCLQDFSLKVAGDFEEEYCLQPEGEEGEEEGEEKGEEKVLSGDFLDLTPEFTSTLILHLPMKPLCREDCRGLCPRCGKNRNEGECECRTDDIDPRLEKLKEFFNR
ncbi:MAG: hypothetical protein PWQ31_39 [Eubacteriales bacterium]|nr:hypothetical protein [Eubacteriales bacterium]